MALAAPAPRKCLHVNPSRTTTKCCTDKWMLRRSSGFCFQCTARSPCQVLQRNVMCSAINMCACVCCSDDTVYCDLTICSPAGPGLRLPIHSGTAALRRLCARLHGLTNWAWYESKMTLTLALLMALTACSLEDACTHTNNTHPTSHVHKLC